MKGGYHNTLPSIHKLRVLDVNRWMVPKTYPRAVTHGAVHALMWLGRQWWRWTPRDVLVAAVHLHKNGMVGFAANIKLLIVYFEGLLVKLPGFGTERGRLNKWFLRKSIVCLRYGLGSPEEGAPSHSFLVAWGLHFLACWGPVYRCQVAAGRLSPSKTYS